MGYSAQSTNFFQESEISGSGVLSGPCQMMYVGKGEMKSRCKAPALNIAE